MFWFLNRRHADGTLESGWNGVEWRGMGHTEYYGRNVKIAQDRVNEANLL